MTKKFRSYEEATKHLDEVDQSDFNQLSLARESDGWAVAHELAAMGELLEKFITSEILNIDDDNGFTVAHVLVQIDRFPEKLITLEILKLTMFDNGWTVAHELVSKDNLPEKFMIPEILLLKSDKGYVYEQLDKYGSLHLDSVKDDLGLYLMAVTKYNYPKIDFDKFKELINKHGLIKMKQMVKLTGKKNQ